ncbi:MAG: isochorismatase family protein, partial [Oceanicoccus sp.]|uniref:isochorismatase family protein n=1 Tax=Oceanicoccus sp. TaxID=2691044 RepID=UPI002610E3C6
ENFNQRLETLQTRNIILVGMEAHVCVLQSALQLLEKNYQVIIPADAVQSSSKLRWKTGLNIAEKAGAVISNTESILFQMVGRAGTDDFKKLLGLIKT